MAAGLTADAGVPVGRRAGVHLLPAHVWPRLRRRLRGLWPALGPRALLRGDRGRSPGTRVPGARAAASPAAPAPAAGGLNTRRKARIETNSRVPRVDPVRFFGGKS